MTLSKRLSFLALIPAVCLRASERFPRPELSDAYQTPETAWALGSRLGAEWLDVATLLLCLALAAWFALGRRSRRGILVLGLFSLLYFGFVRRGCVCSVGSLQNVSEALLTPGVAISALVACFFALPLLSALFFGRVFCAAVCPLGMLQEVVIFRPLHVPRWLSSMLELVPVLFLGISVLLAGTGIAYPICSHDPYISLFRFGGSWVSVAVGLLVLGIGVVIARPYCRFVCPYGVLLRWLSYLSWKKVTITPDECVVCGLCESSCPVDAIEPATADKSSETSRQGIRRLGFAFALLPVLLAAGFFLGGLTAPYFVRLDRDARIEAALAAEARGEPATIDTRAFRDGGEGREVLQTRLAALRLRLAAGGRLLGLFVGLVVGLRYLKLCIRQRKAGYEPDAGCVSCGRCFLSCPQERLRLKRKGTVREAGAPAS